MVSQKVNALMRFGTLVWAVLVVSACATYPRTFSNESPVANFSDYRTYAFSSTLGTDEKGGVRSLLSQYLMDEVTQQMNSRGYTLSDADVDLIFDFNLVTQEKLRSMPSTNLGGYYGYGGYPGYGYYGGYGSGYNISQYTEGTLSVAMVDSASKRVVWEGVSIARITDDVRENLGASVRAAVGEMFTNFRYVAGGTAAPALADNELK